MKETIAMIEILKGFTVTAEQSLLSLEETLVLLRKTVKESHELIDKLVDKL